MLSLVMWLYLFICATTDILKARYTPPMYYTSIGLNILEKPDCDGLE